MVAANLVLALHGAVSHGILYPSQVTVGLAEELPYSCPTVGYWIASCKFLVRA